MPKCESMRSPQSGNPVANQFVITCSDGRYFQSYRSVIAKRDNAGALILDANYWNYSKTTSKYRNQFTGLSTKETEAGIKAGTIKLANLN